jgi:hypothetical protein
MVESLFIRHRIFCAALAGASGRWWTAGTGAAMVKLRPSRA